VAVVALLAALALQAVLSMRLLNVTSDELTHLASGYTYLRTGEFRLNPQHPPLVKLASALPLLFMNLTVDLADPALRVDPPREWDFGFTFFEHNDADRMLFWARLPVVGLSLLAAYGTYRWARAMCGASAGLMALFLYAFDPTLIAHSRFVTMDVPLTCFFVLTLYGLWRYVRSDRWRDLVATGVSLGAALATKYSGLILVPLVGILLALARPPGGGARARGRRAVLAFAAILAVAFPVVLASYLFTAGPGAYWNGLRQVNRDHDPRHLYYLAGEFREGGFPHYFLVAFLIKTPLPTILLLAFSVVLFRRLRAARRIDDVFLVLPAAVVLLVTSTLADNLGVRYLLPVYPLLFIWVSRLAQDLLRHRVGKVAGAVLAAWYLASAAFIYPDHLAYFNELVGGPRNGHRYLDDSNIDWGQDLKRLKAYMDRNGIEEVRLLYFGNASPVYYGIRWRDVQDAEWAGEPPPGIYAVSTHLLIRGEHHARTKGLRTDWLSRYRPIGRVGYSIYLFRFD
jgi:hypothetical protein